MKIRESGMPDEDMWQQFFQPGAILQSLGLGPTCRDVVDFGCGYGTFTIPAARIVRGTVHAFDIERPMADITRAKAAAQGLRNVQVQVRDFVAEGTGLPPASVDYVMLFNILHAEQPQTLLRESFRVLTPHGLLGILHWNCDPTTPRGPPLEIRPRPEQCLAWAVQEGFRPVGPEVIQLPPYHYGLVLERLGS